MESKKKVKGLRAAYVFIPTIIIIGIVYVFIIISTVFINKHTIESSTEMKKTSVCLEQISNMQGTSAKLSEIATSFVHMPMINDRNDQTKEILNETPLKTYIEEISIESRIPENVLAVLEDNGVSQTVYDNVSSAGESINYMKKIQARSLYLINSYIEEKYDISISSYLTNISYTLTDEDTALGLEDKKNLAYSILLGLDYTKAKGNVSDMLREANKNISIDSNQRQAKLTANIKFSRGFLWGSIFLILVLNIAFFAVLLRRLVFPIIRFAKRIDENEMLDSKHSLYEANYLAAAYNSLMDRHKEFENELRDVAEIDVLTGLPNRYSYNSYISKPLDENVSVCVFLFDINKLKYVNDTYGHTEGDILIKNSSNCIKECFLDETGKNCYRIGGDEFVAILKNISKEDIEKYIHKFDEKQKEHNVSIAIGYEYSDDISKDGFEKIIISADKKMYKNKGEIYKKNGEIN